MDHKPNKVKTVVKVAAPSNSLVGVVKRISTGDSIVLHGFRGIPPAEKELILYAVAAPKLARRPVPGEYEATKDEPWAWEAREYLRKKLIGQKVFFTFIKGHRNEYGFVWYGENREDAENIVVTMVKEGFVSVKRDLKLTPEIEYLLELEREAKVAERGKWSRAQPIVRNIQWTNENAAQIVKLYAGKPVKAIIEYIRDGSTIRAFLLPDFRYITMMLSGIRCPDFRYEDEKTAGSNSKLSYADEARFFVEHRLLNREVELLLETSLNNTFVGSILDPRGNIAEALLREGLGKCVEWSLILMKAGNANRLREAENIAREKRLRLWEDYEIKVQPTGEFFGNVVEVFLGDSINVKQFHGEIKRVYLASVCPTRDMGMCSSENNEDNKSTSKTMHNYRPLYDTPYVFQAREFLRRKLIGRRVRCLLNYVVQQTEGSSEKCYYSVFLNRENVAESLVTEGLATCLHYRLPDGQKPLFYDQLLAAECLAYKNEKGIHSKNPYEALSIVDLTIEHKRIKKQYMPLWERAEDIDAVVEYMSSGSRLRLYLPKYNCLVAFILSGVTCPRATRPAQGKYAAMEGEPFGDEALEYTKQLIFQRDVSVQIKKLNKQCNAVVGWVWVDKKTNLSVALVQQGLAEIHVSAETSEHYRPLKNAEKDAKIGKRNIWSLDDKVPNDQALDLTIANDQINGLRIVNLENVLITEITTEMTFYAQTVSDMNDLQTMTSRLQTDCKINPSQLSQYVPKVGEICGAKFSVDKKWYRARVEYIKGNQVGVLYIDYGNKENVLCEDLLQLSADYLEKKPFATEYALALVEPPEDVDDRQQALKIFATQVLNQIVLLNVELEQPDSPALVTLYTLDNYKNIAREMIANGHVLVEQRVEPKLQLLLQHYNRLEESSFYARLGIWKYGDSTEDNAPEFGC